MNFKINQLKLNGKNIMSIDLMSELSQRVVEHMSGAFGKKLPLLALHKGQIDRLGTKLDQSEGMLLFNLMSRPLRDFKIEDVNHPIHGSMKATTVDVKHSQRFLHIQFCKSLAASISEMNADPLNVETMTVLTPVLWMAIATACALDHVASVQELLEAFPFLLGAALPTTFGGGCELFESSFNFCRTHPKATVQLMPAFVALLFSASKTLDFLFATGLNPAAPYGAISHLSRHREIELVTGFGPDRERAIVEMEGPFYDLAAMLRFVAPACKPEIMVKVIDLFFKHQEGNYDAQDRLKQALNIALPTSRFDAFRRGESDLFTANMQWLRVYEKSTWWKPA